MKLCVFFIYPSYCEYICMFHSRNISMFHDQAILQNLQVKLQASVHVQYYFPKIQNILNP